jgi:hypothetical protein
MPGVELGTFLRGDAARYHECVVACVACLIGCEVCSDACLREPDVAR